MGDGTRQETPLRHHALQGVHLGRRCIRKKGIKPRLAQFLVLPRGLANILSCSPGASMTMKHLIVSPFYRPKLFHLRSQGLPSQAPLCGGAETLLVEAAFCPRCPEWEAPRRRQEAGGAHGQARRPRRLSPTAPSAAASALPLPPHGPSSRLLRPAPQAEAPSLLGEASAGPSQPGTPTPGPAIARAFLPRDRV